MPRIFLVRSARHQIRDVLSYTLDKFGRSKRDEYRDLIVSALRKLEADPAAGKRSPDIHPDAWVYHIGQRGRHARHLFLYRIRQDIEVVRFLYDGMDLPRHWPEKE